MRAVYEVSQRFLRDCLLEDGSLFTPGSAVWSTTVLHDLKRRFVDRPDVSSDNFETKFQRQLAGAPPATVQLAAELIFVYFLASKGVTSLVKRQLIETVLGWSNMPTAVPNELLPVLDDGIAMPGMSFNTRRPFLLSYLLEFALRWKGLSAQEQQRLAADPWVFKSFVFDSALKGVQTQQHALLHMLHPDTFEPITSQYRKQDIVGALGGLVDEPSEDVDRHLAAIRAKLAPQYGAEFNFWDDGIREQWARDDREDAEAGADTSVGEGPSVTESIIRESMAELVSDAETRNLLLKGLADAAQAAHAVNPRSWVLSARDRGHGGLRLSVGRVYILAIRSDDVAIAYDPAALSHELREGLQGFDPESFQAEALELVCVPFDEVGTWLPRLTEANLAAARLAARAKGSPYARHHAPVAVQYLRTELGRDLPDPTGRAQGLVREAPRQTAPTKSDTAPYSLEEVAAETGHDLGQLESWVAAIERKGQAILYGPPGTGKTYLAERLAKHLVGGGDGIIQLVQFHPAYAYEDFIQGIRPRVSAGSAIGFELVRGRFLEFCRIAREREGRSVLIIDEINRANLSRVFGELMYLLEYREMSVPLAAGGEFSIPEHVRIIGTMNTADRSIALVDHALRRRFAFLALKPDFDVLRNYHESRGGDFDVEPLIELLRSLNDTIGDPHYEVGITFFLRPKLEAELEYIWKMEIEPYLEEFFFDQAVKAREFRWEKVRSRLRE